MTFHIKFLLVAMMVLYLKSISQNLLPDSSSSSGYKHAVALYSQSLKEELHLFNGKEDKGYPYQFAEGTPYFLTATLTEGSLLYDGKTYEDVSMLYDVVADQVVYLYFDGRSRIKLVKDRVSAFSLMGHHFINIKADRSQSGAVPSGFYDRLYNGMNTLLAKRTKKIESAIKLSGSETRVFGKDYYYLKKGETYYAVSNKRSFLRNLSDKRRELQQYIRQNRFNFRKDMENAMVKTLAYYEQLIK